MTLHDELDLERLHDLLEDSPVGHTVEYHRTVESTMPIAHKLAAHPEVRAGHIVVAEQQMTGAGRRGRSWQAPYATSILTSVILKPPLLPETPEAIPMAAALAVTDALRDAAPALTGRVSLKWPNDVLLLHDGREGKVAGILIESALQGESLRYAILGIGINVNQKPTELPEVVPRMSPPVSLRSVLGRPLDRTRLLSLICAHLGQWYDPEIPRESVYEAWRAGLSTLGRRVDVYLSPNSGVPDLSGVAADVSPSGELLVRENGGKLHRFSAADVTVRAAD